jgi:hypothetical protein
MLFEEFQKTFCFRRCTPYSPKTLGMAGRDEEFGLKERPCIGELFIYTQAVLVSL